jgi:tetratricopeptide (TPR) repeat protein
MGENGSLRHAGSEERAPKGDAAAPRSGVFRDPVVRKMTYAAYGLVILMLATVLSVLVTGVAAPTGPRTAAEQQLLLAAAQVRQPGARGDSWAPYVVALVNTGDLAGARAALAQARATADSSASAPQVDLSEARLLKAETRYTEAIIAAQRAIDSVRSDYTKRVDSGGATATATLAAGLGATYYEALLVQAYSFAELRRWTEAVAQFDAYLKANPTASDIFVDRGNAKAELKDKAGAEKDFRQALRFVPYDEGAKAGLKRIGVAP